MSTQLLNWLAESGYPIDSQQTDKTERPSFIAPLTEYSVIRVSGQDAEKFMQGQFSCDVRDVTSEQSRMGTANTPKGRAFAVFRIAKQGDDYLIRLPTAIAEDFSQRLNKYIVFSKATLALDENLCVLGFSGDSNLLSNSFKSTHPLPTGIDSSLNIEDSIVVKVPAKKGARFEIFCSIDTAKSLLSKPQGEAPSAINFGTQALWSWEDISEGVADIYPETQESFVPQMLNLQHLNAISFKKGCYTGQEIVARMKYLGKLKKEMFLLAATGTNAITPGTDIYDKESNKKVGSVVRSIFTHSSVRGNVNDIALLAVLDIETAKSNRPLSLENDNSRTFQYLTLPYQNSEEG
ncbi:CAF17-like 4Fe-4S cluster assembly/insertion protein YgfZ [Alkalimarinus alittae]|uniref:Aminomethyltransferase folate-binding domain-containing protein n=1 Tax=Alkalimarinus alittae TaxID=2961619 RepID=A0ABY6MZN8_9ALTE|nr:hypothetical protein [Alkalimarinus alittae]UZE95237.1 hypothetical protein NKI27_14350 [Alkalimarinus alittae]